ncbi:hypothetical protein PhCBS80983_g05001 [Powellomyces hirtus]|uniref:Enoyl reductase (ER) domain-containing protein n=1 Tax=Powellomyces hirtus TaxID=109895 RepID=A0A507DVP0_9FUNG|nr:hypothetical protein PhCBS80983_g05001 [Powellomyces hirtus]
MATYKAAQFTGYGGVDKIEINDATVPVLASNDVLIKVHAASLNPIDWKIAEGQLKMISKSTFPLRTGYDVSGVIEAVGTAVTTFSVGQAVYSRVGETAGTVAEFVVTQVEKIALKPTSLSHEEAAGIPLTALTAYQALDRAGFKNRTTRKFFVPAGAGGVGHMAIQLAKHSFNAEEVATTVSEKKIDIVKSLGADVVVDYHKDDFTQVLKDYDMAFDTTGEAIKQLAILKEGGSLYSIATIPDGDEIMKALGSVGFVTRKLLDVLSLRYRWAAQKKKVDYHYVFMSPNGAQLKEIAELADSGKLKVLVDSTHPFTLEGVRAAFERQKSGRATGKVIIKMI